MVAKKRQASNKGNSSASQKPSKRQRVTCACDSCRLARERCDGSRPRCLSCTNQKRECKYTRTVRKRGVPRGYLKTIELSLAWLMEQNPTCEKVLHCFLADGTLSARLLQCRTQEGHQLHQRWSKGAVHKSIVSLLTSKHDQRYESCESSEAEYDSKSLLSQDSFSKSSPNTSHLELTPMLPETTDSQVFVMLPSNWQALIEIYRIHTHSWFPLVKISEVVNTAQEYPKEGIDPGSLDISPAIAELWAVMAIAAFHEPLLSTQDSTFQSQKLFSKARSLVPWDGETLALPHLRALLLHSLVLMGQGAGLAAWLLIGTATRLSLHLKYTGLLQDGGGPSIEHRMRAACFILDTLASTGLGYPSMFNPDSSSVHETESQLRRWRDDKSSDRMPQKSLLQLFRFCCFLGRHARGTQSSLPSMGDIVRSLDPVFASCNSVLRDLDTTSPSAFLIQVAFLVTTVQLSSDNRCSTSLATNLIEVVECCETSLGPTGTPPLVLGLLAVFRRSQHFRLLHAREKARLHTTTNAMTAAWAHQRREYGIRTPTCEPHNYMLSHEIGVLCGLPSPQDSTTSNAECETVQSQSLWPGIPSLSETSSNSALHQSGWESSLGEHFSFPRLDPVYSFESSLGSSESPAAKQTTEDVLKEPNASWCLSDNGEDSGLIGSFDIDESDLGPVFV